MAASPTTLQSCWQGPLSAGRGAVLVAQACPTLRDPVDCSPARLLCPWDSPGKTTGVGGHALLQGIFPTQGLSLGLLRCRQTPYCLPGNHTEVRDHSAHHPRLQPTRGEARSQGTPLLALSKRSPLSAHTLLVSGLCHHSPPLPQVPGDAGEKETGAGREEGRTQGASCASLNAGCRAPGQVGILRSWFYRN